MTAPGHGSLSEGAEEVNAPLPDTRSAAHMRKSALMKCEAALWFIVALLAAGLSRIW